MKTANRIMAAILIVASLLCLVGVGVSFKDVISAKEKWTERHDEAIEKINMLKDGVSQLSENFETFANGVITYEDGSKQFEEGKKLIEENEIKLAEGEETLASSKETLNAGVASYASGAAQLEAAHQSYNEAVAKLEAGKQQLAEGKAELEANREAYNEGKQKLALVQPIYTIVMPLNNSYNAAKAQYDAAVAAGDEAAAASAQSEMDKYSTLMNASLAGYTIPSLCAEYESGQEQIAAFEAAEAKIAAAEATISENEAKLAAAKATLDSKDNQLAAAGGKISAGRVAIADGEKKLEDGKKQLAEGKETLASSEIQLTEGREKLAVYEDGEAQLIAGLDTLVATDTYYTEDGKAIVPSIGDRLGDYSYWLKGTDGEDAVWLGSKVVDLDKASLAAETALSFLDDVGVAVTDEVVGRIIDVLVLAVAAILGIVGGILGLAKKNLAACIISWIAFFGALTAIIIPGFGAGFTYPLCADVSAYTMGILGFCIILAVASLVYVVINMCTKKDAE